MYMAKKMNIDYLRDRINEINNEFSIVNINIEQSDVLLNVTISVNNTSNKNSLLCNMVQSYILSINKHFNVCGFYCDGSTIERCLSIDTDKLSLN